MGKLWEHKFEARWLTSPWRDGTKARLWPC